MRRLLLFGVFAVVACSPDSGNSAGPLSPDVTITVNPLVSGAVLASDGSNICSTLSDPFSLIVVRPIQPGGPILPAIFLFCPSNTFATNLAAGNYFLRAALPDDPLLGERPTRTVVPLTVGGSDVVQNIVVQPGLTLGGRASIDGAPLPGVDMTLTYGFAPAFGAAFGASGDSGIWSEFFRPQMFLQPGVQYAQVGGGCTALGARILESPPVNFLFPTEVSAVNCKLETSASTKFSHAHTRVVVTPMPGEIGGQSNALVNQYGIGWGVQFPVPPGQSPAYVPATASQLFGGGLLIGLAPDRILSGIDLAGQVQCTSCQDLGRDGVLHYTPDGPNGRTVTWRYSDAGSAEGVGLRVMQRSYDGQLPNDYVLFKFSIQNKGPATVTFYAGDFMDWDVDVDAGEDNGFTELDGRLMGVTSAFEETGIHVGTLLLGGPISGVSFWNPFEIPGIMTTATQFQSLSGARQEFSVDVADVHYIQGAGPFTLKRAQKVTVWIGIIAGESRDAFIANALAAQADVARRQGEDDDAASDGPLTVIVKPGVAQPRVRKLTKVL